MPRNPAGLVRIRSLAADAPHPRARDEWRIRPDGRIEGRTLYAAEPLGERIATAMLDLHQGRWFGLAGTVAFLLAALAMPLFAVTGLLLYLGRRRSRRRPARAPAVPAAAYAVTATAARAARPKITVAAATPPSWRAQPAASAALGQRASNRKP